MLRSKRLIRAQRYKVILLFSAYFTLIGPNLGFAQTSLSCPLSAVAPWNMAVFNDYAPHSLWFNSQVNTVSAAKYAYGQPLVEKTLTLTDGLLSSCAGLDRVSPQKKSSGVSSHNYTAIFETTIRIDETATYEFFIDRGTNSQQLNLQVFLQGKLLIGSSIDDMGDISEGQNSRTLYKQTIVPGEYSVTIKGINLSPQDILLNRFEIRKLQKKFSDAEELLISLPYKDTYAVTQLGHIDNFNTTRSILIDGNSPYLTAIDLGVGEKNTPLYSPISGVVTFSGIDRIDAWNNTILTIENSFYTVLMLHGNYSLRPGTVVKKGDFIGTEGNNGYVLTGEGVLCSSIPYLSNCGYHTHINVWDKRLGFSVNILDLVPTN